MQELTYEQFNLLPDDEKKKYKPNVYDEQFIGGGFEDVDLFLRLRDTYGMKIIMSGRSMFWHKEGATRWESDVQKYYKELDNENSIKFEKKWGFNYWKKSVWKQIDIFNA